MTGRPARQVWVLRHAKAGPHRPDDHGRPLVERGRRQCAELAAHLAEADDVDALPPLVLVSSATRARTTAELVVEALGGTAELREVRSLYRADADGVLALLHELDDATASVMVVGHNPTLEELVWLLLDDEGRRRFDGLSTCALAVVGLEAASWPAVVPGGGRLLAHYAPVSR